MTERVLTLKDRKDLLWLDALQAAGVDNWDGIEFAHEIYRDNLEEEGLSENDDEEEGLED